MGGNDEVELGAAEFRLLRDRIHTESGILLRDEARALLERRLRPRLAALGLRDFGAYHRFLRNDPGGAAEMDVAIEAASTHETYFFREPHQLRAFSEEILPRLRAEKGSTRRIRIWSAGCSTGEEAYTIAMLLLEQGPWDGWQVEVFGTDLSRRALSVARRGVYGPSAMRGVDTGRASRFLLRDGDRWHVKEPARRLVTFAQMNLLDGISLGLLGRVDAVFCRNVMIYFDRKARRRALEGMHDRLVVGGYLLLGHAESLLGVATAFEPEQLKHDLVYRRAQE